MDVPDGHIPGTILLDGFLQSFVQGIILTQLFKYWADYHDDSRRKRIFVVSVVVLVIVQTVLEDYKVWRLTRNQEQWWMGSWQWTDIFLNGLICSLCEAFFIRRCWKVMNKNNWVLSPLAFLSLTILVANVYLAVAVQKVTYTLMPGQDIDTLMTSRDLFPSTIVAFTYWIFGSLVLDISITTTLVICLWRSRIGLVESDKVLYHVIAITWESAALPSVFMITAVSIYHANPHSNYHLVRLFVLTTGKLYTVGLLRTLNSRVKLRERMKSHDLGRVSLGEWQWEQSHVAGTQNTAQLPPTTVVPLLPSAEMWRQRRV